MLVSFSHYGIQLCSIPFSHDEWGCTPPVRNMAPAIFRLCTRIYTPKHTQNLGMKNGEGSQNVVERCFRSHLERRRVKCECEFVLQDRQYKRETGRRRRVYKRFSTRLRSQVANHFWQMNQTDPNERSFRLNEDVSKDAKIRRARGCGGEAGSKS